MPQPNLQYPSYTPPDPKRAPLGWWGMGSLAAGALGLAFLPAAILDGGDWVEKLWYLSPLWAICCIIGIITGIRGTQFQRRATKLQRTTAFIGTILSLLTFMVLTIIVTILSG